MSDKQSNEGNVAEEFRKLGKNLSEVLNTIWESPERKKIQDDVTRGITELTETLKKETKNFAESPAGQQMKANARDFQQRVRSGEVENKVKEELVTALRIANAQLRQAIENMSANKSAYSDTSVPPSPADKTGGRGEVGPDDQNAPSSDVPHQEVHPDDF